MRSFWSRWGCCSFCKMKRTLYVISVRFLIFNSKRMFRPAGGSYPL